MIEPTLSPHRAPSRSRAWWLGQIGLYLLLWFSLHQLPTPASADLDPSWQMVLGMASHENLQHGRDIVFTYGPLGYYSRASSYMSELFGLQLAWQFIANLFIAAGLYVFGRSFRGWRQVVYYAYLLWLGTSYSDAMQMNFITIFGLMLARSEYRRPIWILAIGALFAVFALIKFTNLMLCLFVLGTVCAYYLTSGGRREAVRLACTFVAVFLGGWLVCGQDLRNIPAFLYYGWQLSDGYIGAMGLYETPMTLALGIGAAASITGYAALYLFTSRDKLRAFSICLILGAAIFINWKHGFVRADGHVLAHYLMVLLVVCTYPALTQDEPNWGRTKSLILGTAGVLCLIGIARLHAPTVWEAPSMWNYRLRDNITAVLDPRGLQAKLERSRLNAAEQAAKPVIRAFVGDETVDHLGSDQGQSVLNRLNYTPRPAIQGYTTYTEALNKLDESFYRSDRAPRFVLQRYQSIDDRLITQDDSLTLKLLFQNYDYVFEEGGLLLWERPQTIRAYDPEQEPVLLESKSGFDQAVVIPDTDRPLWAQIHVEPSLLGRLRKFLYKPPIVRIELEDDRGTRIERRFIPAMGAAGFILQPLFDGSDELIAYQNGSPMRKVRSLTLRTESRWRNYFQPEITIEIRTLMPFTRATDGIKVTAPHRFRMSNRPPQDVSAASPVIDTFVDGRHLLQMHPPSRMRFAIPDPITSVNASFGIMPGAYSGPEGTQGVEFIIEWQGSSGQSEILFSRLLDPARTAGDRPMQTLHLDFPARSDGQLLLRTDVGPSGSGAWSWSFWTDIEIR